MNFIKGLLLLLVGVGIVYGESADTNSFKIVSTSADGKYQIRAYPYVPPPNPDPIGIAFSEFWIYDTQSNKKDYLIEGLFDERYDFDWRTHWHPNKPWVAVEKSDGRYSGDIAFITFKENKWCSLPMPTYKQVAWGMVGGLTASYGIVHFREWQGDDAILDYSFNAYRFNRDVIDRDKATDDKLWKLMGRYDFLVRLWIRPSRFTVELIGLKKVKEE